MRPRPAACSPGSDGPWEQPDASSAQGSRYLEPRSCSPVGFPPKDTKLYSNVVAGPQDLHLQVLQGTESPSPQTPSSAGGLYMASPNDSSTEFEKYPFGFIFVPLCHFHNQICCPSDKSVQDSPCPSRFPSTFFLVSHLLLPGWPESTEMGDLTGPGSPQYVVTWARCHQVVQQGAKPILAII